jgi:glycosyltransferase involved in cell wall biosynthesis
MDHPSSMSARSVVRVPAGRPAQRLAVLIPCLDEARTVGGVIDDLRAVLPEAEIVVFDNDSADETAAKAAAHGALVIHEPRRGKGFVVERMFDAVDAECFVMLDGDGTYDVSRIREMIALVTSGRADMVVGARIGLHHPRAFSRLHLFGNKLVRGLVNWVFGTRLTDILSGFRVFNARVVRTLPVASQGFEVETEMTAHLLYYNLKIREIPVAYANRPPGSQSKLRTFRDGLRVLVTVARMARVYRPFAVFGWSSLLLLVCGLAAGLPPVQGFIESGFREVRRFPLAILATGLVLLSAGSFFAGLVLDAINQRFRDLHNVVSRASRGS